MSCFKSFLGLGMSAVCCWYSFII